MLIATHAPGNDVAGYVERFRKGSSVPGDIVDKMRESLKAWGVNELDGVEIEHAREFTVIRAFFQTLSKPSESLKGLSETDKEHAYWKFLSQLPDVSCMAWSGDDVKKVVEKQIRKIATNLYVETDSQSDVVLIDRIRKKMNYGEWLKNQNKNEMTTKSEPGCESLKSLVHRFGPHKR